MKDPRIYIAGHKGMVGSAILRQLDSLGYKNIITRSHSELDLISQDSVRKFFELEKPDQVYLSAAKVGGINANNTYPADFIYDNLMIQSNVINSAFQTGVKKILFLGSSCIYPKNSPQPMSEKHLLTGTLESTNEPYAIAKIAGIKLCESYNRQFATDFGIDYRCVMPTNLYGIGDNYHPTNSHVIPGLIRRFHEAKVHKSSEVKVWGSGMPKREFLYVDDLASACIHVMNIKKSIYESNTTSMLSHINVGSGDELTIRDLAEKISEIVNYKGQIVYDKEKPDGSMRKLLDISRLKNLGWESKMTLENGLRIAYKDFLNKQY